MALLALDSNMYHMVVVLSEQNLSFGAQLELMTSYLNNEAKCTKKSNGKKGISKHTATGFFRVKSTCYTLLLDILSFGIKLISFIFDYHLCRKIL